MCRDFAEPQHPVFRQLNASIGFDWRLGPYDVEQSRAHATMLAATGTSSATPTATPCSAGSSASRPSCDDGTFPFDARRRGHPHGDRAAADRDRRPGRRQAPHRPLAQRPGGHRRRDVHARARAGDAEASSSTCRACSSSSPRATRTGRCRATRTCSARSPSTSSHHLLAYFWMFRRDARRFEFVLGSTSELPLGAGALAGVNFATDRQLVARELGFAERRPELDRRGLQPRLRARLPRRRRRPARRTSRGSGPRSCCGPRRSSASARSRTRGRPAPRSCRRRRTPTRPSCCARKAPRVVARLTALHGVMHGLPLTYNKDMQEDKEHLFDAVDTLDLCLQAAAGMLETIALRPQPARGRRRRRADRRDRHRRPARQARRPVPPVARDRGRDRARDARGGAPALRPHAARSSRATPRRSTTSSTTCSPSSRGSSPRSRRAARRSRACASS